MVSSNFDSARKRHQSAAQPRTSFQASRQGGNLLSNQFRAYDDSHLETAASTLTPGIDPKEGRQCLGWAQGWAEIVIRRPAGKTSFLLRLGNSLNLPCYCPTSCDNNSSISMVNVYNPGKILERTQSVVMHRTHDGMKKKNSRSSLTSFSTEDSNINRKTSVDVHETSSSSTSCSSNSQFLPVKDKECHETTFRRTSSSPEIERQAAMGIIDTNNTYSQPTTEESGEIVEEGKEVKDDTSLLSQSPSKSVFLSRTVSLGKGDGVGVNSNLNRTCSFNQRNNKSPVGRIDEFSCVNSNSSATTTSMKKNLQINCNPVVNGKDSSSKVWSSSAQASPTKSSGSSSSNCHPNQSADVVDGCVLSTPFSGNVSTSSQDVSSTRNLAETAVMRERSHTFSASSSSVAAASTATNASSNSTSSAAPAVIQLQQQSTGSGSAGTLSRSPKPTLTSQHSLPVGHQQHANQAFEFGIHHHKSVGSGGGLSPSFVFLQLFYNPSFNTGHSEKPILLNKSPGFSSPADIDRALKNLDLITPFETHKIGVVYIAPGQEEDKLAILSNSHGSPRYQGMLEDMAQLIRLKDVDEQNCYLGGLDVSKQMSDGLYTYAWHDTLTQVVFHVSTLMPKSSNDPNCNNKFRHIGNDYVCIAYNDSGKEFHKTTIAVSCFMYLFLFFVNSFHCFPGPIHAGLHCDHSLGLWNK